MVINADWRTRATKPKGKNRVGIIASGRIAREHGRGWSECEHTQIVALGDVQLDEAMRLTGDRFLITGGISAMETETFRSADEVRLFVKRRIADREMARALSPRNRR